MAMREVFKPRLEELTDGKYDIQIYDSGVLGSEKVAYKTIPEAESSRCAWWGRQCGSETPVMAIPDFPFVFRDVEHARRCYQGRLGSYIARRAGGKSAGDSDVVVPKRGKGIFFK